MEFSYSSPVILALYSNPLESAVDVEKFEAIHEKQNELFNEWSNGALKIKPVFVESFESIESLIQTHLEEGEYVHSLIFIGKGNGHRHISYGNRNDLSGGEFAELLVKPGLKNYFKDKILKVYFADCYCGFSARNNEGFQDAFMKRSVELNQEMNAPFEGILSLAHPYLMSQRSYQKGVGELSVAFHSSGFYRLIQKVIILLQSRKGNAFTGFLFSLFKEPKRTAISMTFAVTMVLAFPKIFGPFYIIYTGLNQLGFKVIDMLQVGTARRVSAGIENSSRHMPIRRAMHSYLAESINANSCKALLN